VKQIHVPMRPFLTAFRADLLEDVQNGRAVTTPHFVRGMQLVASEIEKIGKVTLPKLIVVPMITLTSCIYTPYLLYNPLINHKHAMPLFLKGTMKKR